MRLNSNQKDAALASWRGSPAAKLVRLNTPLGTRYAIVDYHDWAKPAERWCGRLLKEVVKRQDGTLSVWWTGTDVLGRTRKAVIGSLVEEAVR